MSARYSNSPALRLRIGKSKIRQALYLVLCCNTLFALALLHGDGYTELGLALSLPASALLWCVRRPAMQGVELCWRQGLWTLEHSWGEYRVITPGTRLTVLPWVIHLPFTGAAGSSNESLWIFLDSVAPQHWRQLRARLTLQAGKAPLQQQL